MASYKQAIQFIADEDAPGDDETDEEMEGYLTVALTSFLFNKPQIVVARDVYQKRHPELKWRYQSNQWVVR